MWEEIISIGHLEKNLWERVKKKKKECFVEGKK